MTEDGLIIIIQLGILCNLTSDVSYPTFRKWTKRYELWKPNHAGKGIPKKKRTGKYLSCSGKEGWSFKEDYNNMYINKL